MKKLSFQVITLKLPTVVLECFRSKFEEEERKLQEHKKQGCWHGNIWWLLSSRVKQTNIQVKRIQNLKNRINYGLFPHLL